MSLFALLRDLSTDPSASWLHLTVARFVPTPVTPPAWDTAPTSCMPGKTFLQTSSPKRGPMSPEVPEPLGQTPFPKNIRVSQAPPLR